MACVVVDALGRTVSLVRPARRVVSLVPSETETVATLAGLFALAGRTTYCEEPAGTVESIPVVGGTKNVDVAAVVALGPDLVLANQEENTRSDVDALVAAGLEVHVSFPQTLRDVAHYLEAVGTLLAVDVGAHVRALHDWVAIEETPRFDDTPRPRAFVPIWDEPLMTFDERTYGSRVLAAAGVENAFAGRARRYPLAADLGSTQPMDAARVGDRDTRYPRTTPDEVMARRPDLVLLPDEPYRYGPADVPRFRRFAERVECVSGKDLFWYGTRTAAACARMAQLLTGKRPA